MERMRAVVRDVWKGYAQNDVLTFASAISFQVLKALVPLLLFAFGLLGALGLDDVYQQHVVPDLRDSVSKDMFGVIDSTVRNVLDGHQTFWISIGAIICIWEMSGAARAVMDGLDRIYCCRRERSAKERYTVSILLATGTGILLLLAVA